MRWISNCSWMQLERILKDDSLAKRYVRLRGTVDIACFIKFVLSNHIRLPFADFHHDLFRWHLQLGDQPLPDRRGRRLALAAPRGAAKTTILTLGLVLHDIVYRREPYILIISATQRQAQRRLSALRAELLGGSGIRHFASRINVGVSANTLLTPHTRIDAHGANSELRGLSHDSWRPTKIILDDAESSAVVTSPKRRQRIIDWFGEVIEHLGDSYTHIIVIGTVLHPDSLLATLMRRVDFEGRLYRSIVQFAPPSPHWDTWRSLLTDALDPDRRATARSFFLEHREAMTAGARVLWPEHEDIEELQAQLLTQGRRVFYQEKQNEPLSASDALFRTDAAWTARIDGDTIALFPPGNHTRTARTLPLNQARRFGFLDAALGKSARSQQGDFAALATVLLLPGPLLVLSHLWIERATPSAQIEMILLRHATDPFERIGIEGTGFQEMIATHLGEQSHARLTPIPIEVVRPTHPKQTRIAALEPLLVSGRLVLAENLPEEFCRELADYPATAHDDALDAAASATALALTAARQANQTIVQLPRHRKGSAF
jgi:predicted phage terminase large subunit-like protein